MGILFSREPLFGVISSLRQRIRVSSLSCQRLQGSRCNISDGLLIFSSTSKNRLQESHYGTILQVLRSIALSTLKAFWDGNPAYTDAIEPILAWYRHALKADWASPAEVKQDFRNASILKDGRVVFNITGNKYRLVVWINYAYRVVYIRFIGTHAQYDQIDVQTI